MYFRNRTFSALVALLLLGVTASALGANTAPTASSMGTGVYQNDVLEFYAPGVLTNATDPEGDALTAVLIVGTQNGNLTLNADGGFIYTPGWGYAGPDSFQFAAYDGSLYSAPATVDISVIALPGNNAPVGADATYQGFEDTALDGMPVGLSAWCSDADGDVMTFALVAAPQSGTLQLNADGTFGYQPAPEYSGTDSFSYMVSDAVSSAGPYVVTLLIQAVNDAPSASDDQFALLEDEVFSVSAAGVLANDMDIEGDVISAIATSLPIFGSLILKPDGSFEYSPQADFNGNDSFSYYADDGQGQSQIVTVTLFVQAMNDAPSFTGAGDVTVNEDDGVINLQWAKNIIAGPADESWQSAAFNVSISQSSKLFITEPVIDDTGMLYFELAPDAWGTADVTVTLRDDGGATLKGERDTSDSVTFRIFVVASNDAPSFIPGGNVDVLEDCGPQSITWATGINSGAGDTPQQLRFFVTDVSNAALFVAGPSVDTNGQLSFTPAPDANGSSRVVLVLTEAVLTVSADASSVGTPQSFIISVQAVNDAPVFIAGPNLNVRGHASNVITGWATGISAGAADEQGQVLQFQFLGVENSVLFEGKPSIDSMGTLNFTPRRGMQGIATITLMLLDDGGSANGGQCNSQVQTFTIEIRNDDLEAQGSCSAGTGGMPWWLWLAAPMAMLAVLRRRRAMA